jgi:flavin reductase (DIM6/NTAB) family NADH-FMN oxidoreductase RutF
VLPSHNSNNTSNDVSFEVLPNCASYIQLKLKQVADGGDHDVAICEVVGTGVWDDENNNIKWLSENETGNQIALDSTSVLYTGLLREEGII